MVFRKGGRLSTKDKWFSDGEEIEIELSLEEILEEE